MARIGQGEYAALWSAVIKVCAIDIPGFGMSPPPNRKLQFDLGIRSQLYPIILKTSMGFDRVVLVGNSMGGGRALRFAIDHPDRTLGIIVANSVGIGKEIAWSLRFLSLPWGCEIFYEFG